MAKIVLKAQNLEVGYKGLSIAQNIDFQINAGDFCAIIGSNGSGKSTVLRTMANLHSPVNGSVQLQGKEVKEYSPRQLAQEIAVVLTEPVAAKNIMVKELVALGRQPYTDWLGRLTDEDRSRIEYSLEALQLRPLASRKCYELSDGQLQRALIARALAQDTSIILLDEPTTHLDLEYKVQIVKLLRELAHEHHKTIVFSTHEVNLALQLCNKMLLMDGRINPFGEPMALAETGAFSKLFPSGLVTFDSTINAFKANTD